MCFGEASTKKEENHISAEKLQRNITHSVHIDQLFS
jgi:hypothetical protein